MMVVRFRAIPGDSLSTSNGAGNMIAYIGLTHGGAA